MENLIGYLILHFPHDLINGGCIELVGETKTI